MLYEEDIILHGSTIADSEGLLHGKYKSKHKSKSGKWVYVYDNAKKAVGDLFDKDVDTRYVSGSAKGNVNSDSQEKLFRKSIKEEDKKIKKMLTNLFFFCRISACLQRIKIYSNFTLSQ